METSNQNIPATKISWFQLFILTPLARLRFIFILGAIGLVLAKWETLVAISKRVMWSQVGGEIAGNDYEYFCPMHPSFSSQKKNEKCPICFMALSRRKKGGLSSDALPPGIVSRVQLSPYRIALAGVKTHAVGYSKLVKEINTVGTVEFDERELKHVASRVKGRIEKLVVNQTGQMVHKGDELAVLFSPDMIVTVQNLLDARRSNNSIMEKNARERLELWGVGLDEIDKIIRDGVPLQRIPIRSPIDGHVLKKYPKEGQYVEEGGPLYDVANLDRVWVLAQLYEEDLGFFTPVNHQAGKANTKADHWRVIASSRAYPSEKFEGVLSFIYPHVDQESRTLSVRFEMANPGNRLRPGMATKVQLQADASQLASLKRADGKPLFSFQVKDEKVLCVPEESVIHTGELQIVYKQDSPGVYLGISVKLGPRLNLPDGQPVYPVYSGIKAGDEIVTQGSFLIDAETRLNPSLGSIYFGGSSNKAAIRPTTPNDEEVTIAANLAKLSAADKKIALEQLLCLSQENSKLGSMGVPIKFTIEGQTAFVCCEGCLDEAKSNPAKTMQRLKQLKSKTPQPKAKTGDVP